MLKRSLRSSIQCQAVWATSAERMTAPFEEQEGGKLVNSGPYNGLSVHEAILAMSAFATWTTVGGGSGPYSSELPPSVSARVSVEMSTPQGWERYVGFKGQMIGMHSFGASAPWKDLQKHFGFTTDAVIAAARKTIAASI